MSLPFRPCDDFRPSIPRLELLASHRDFSDDRIAIFARAHCSSNGIAFTRTLDLFCNLGAASNQLHRLSDRRARLRGHELAPDVAATTVRLGNGGHHRRALDGQSALA